MKTIMVRGYEVLMDDDVWEFVNRIGISVVCPVGAPAAPRAILKVKGLSHVVVSPGRGHVVDHINGNTLDNRRCNLQVLPHAVNLMKKRTTEHPGVARLANGTYRVRTARGRQRFKDLSRAQAEADTYRRSLNVRGMPLNFPEVGEHYWDGRERVE